MAIALALSVLDVLAFLVGCWLFVSRHRAAACFTLGGALASTVVGIAIAWAISPDPGTNAAGVTAWGVLAAVSLAVLLGAGRPTAQFASFALGVAACLTLIGAGFYLVFAFKIF